VTSRRPVDLLVVALNYNDGDVHQPDRKQRRLRP
jgi:hypothetical protein